MGERSFGLVLLLLSVFGLLCGVSAFVAVLLMVPAIQMFLARSGPIFPHDEYVAAGSRRAASRPSCAILWLERFVRPRWTTPVEGIKRVICGIVLRWN